MTRQGKSLIAREETRAGVRAVLAPALLASACSIVTDFDELHRGSRDAGTPSSSGGPSEGGAPVDGSTAAEGGTSSSGTVRDAGIDCIGATFCDGFERDEPQGAWSDFSVTKGSTFAITREHPRSGAAAIRYSIKDSVSASAMLLQDFPPAKAVELRYSFWVDVIIKQTNLFALSFVNGTTARSVFLVITAGKAVYVEELTVAGAQKELNQSDPMPVPLGRWVDVAIALDLTTRNTQVTFDGKTMVEAYTVGALPSDSPRLLGGVSWSGPGAPFDLDVDDVRFTLVSN